MKISDIIGIVVFLSLIFGIIVYRWQEAGAGMTINKPNQVIVVECRDGKSMARANRRFSGERIWVPVVGFDLEPIGCSPAADDAMQNF